MCILYRYTYVPGYTYSYICIYTYANLYFCIHVYINICMYIHIHKYINTCLYIYIYVYTNECMHIYICICTCTFTCTNIHTLIYTYRYVYVYTYIYTHVNIDMYTCVQEWAPSEVASKCLVWSCSRQMLRISPKICTFFEVFFLMHTWRMRHVRYERVIPQPLCTHTLMCVDLTCQCLTQKKSFCHMSLACTIHVTRKVRHVTRRDPLRLTFWFREYLTCPYCNLS